MGNIMKISIQKRRNPKIIDGRFYTEEKFIKLYGQEWRYNLEFYWPFAMDIFFGKLFSEIKNIDCSYIDEKYQKKILFLIY